MKKVSLYFKQGGSDKEYHIQIEPSGSGYAVNFQYGRRGGPMTPGSKTKDPVTLPEAEKIFDRLQKEKEAKGYLPNGEVKSNFSGSATTKEVIMVPQLLNPVEETELNRLINDASFLAQEKFDGQQRSVISNGSVTGLNKKGQAVELPTTITSAIEGIHCIVDGEIIGDMLIVFDLRSKGDKLIEHLDCRERIATLNTIKFGKDIIVAKTAYTPKEKRELYEELKSRNAEGIVFKNKLAAYSPGRPASGGNALKLKFYKTATFIVQSHTKGKRSVGLGLVDQEANQNSKKIETVHMGKVTIPANHEIPEVGDFVEVRYLYAYKGGCIFQPVYLGKRNDCDITDAGIGQIIYKAETADI